MRSTMKSLIKALLPDRLWPSLVAHKTFERITSNPEILDGPFRGMRYIFASKGSALVPKILGIYEKELRPTIDGLNRRQFRFIYVIGAAEGYYAVGMALKQPQAKVVAYEADPTAHRFIRDLALRNGVAERVEICGICSASDMESLEVGSLIIMDVEGAEEQLLGRASVSYLEASTVLFEAHFPPAETEEKILSKFRASHSIERIDTLPRSWRDVRCLPWPLVFYIRRNIGFWTDEMRGGPMQWYLLTPGA